METKGKHVIGALCASAALHLAALAAWPPVSGSPVLHSFPAPLVFDLGPADAPASSPSAKPTSSKDARPEPPPREIKSDERPVRDVAAPPREIPAPARPETAITEPGLAPATSPVLAEPVNTPSAVAEPRIDQAARDESAITASPVVPAASPAAERKPPAEQPNEREAASGTTDEAREDAATDEAPRLAASAAGSLPTHPDARESQRAALRADYEQILFAWLRERKQYPMVARRRRLEGEALLSIVIERSGRVSSCRFVHRTGHAVLDDAALRLVARADPFPPMPADYPGDRFEFTAPVTFVVH